MKIPDNIINLAMRAAWSEARRSRDPSTQLGAILLTKNGDFISSGINNLPKCTPQEVWNDREEKYRRVIHAEQSAYLTAAKCSREVVYNSVLVCPWSCCVLCAGFIVEGGTKTLIVDRECMDRQPDRWKESVAEGWDLLRKNNIEIIEWDMPDDWVKPVTVFDGEVW